jgi:probable HAF family extracellular repeat protein
MTPLSSPAALVLASLFLCPPALSQVQVQREPSLRYPFELLDVGVLNPSGTSRNGGLNNRGEVTGTGTAPNGLSEHAFLFSGGTLTDLGTLGGQYSWGNALNDSGVIVGYSAAGPVDLHAYRWNAGVMSNEHVGNEGFSRANDITPQGAVVGVLNGFFDPGIQTTFRGYFAYGATFEIIPTFGGTESQAMGANARGQVTGLARTLEGKLRAFLWDYSGAMTDLGDLGDGMAYGSGINLHGHVVGYSRVPSGDLHAFLHDGTSMIDLGTLGGAASRANNLNDFGLIVGAADDAVGQQRAFLWSDGHMHDLNDLIEPNSAWLLTAAGNVNALGEISATGKYNGQQRACLLRPRDQAPRSSGLAPPLAGDSTTVFVTGFDPGDLVELYSGLARGSSTANGCPLELAAPQLEATAVIGPDGRAELTVSVPSAAAGLTVYTQVLAPSTCRSTAPVVQLVY